MIKRVTWSADGVTETDEYVGTTLALAQSRSSRYVIVWDGAEPQRIPVDNGMKLARLDNVPAANGWLWKWAHKKWRRSSEEDLYGRRVHWQDREMVRHWGVIMNFFKDARGEVTLVIDSEDLGVITRSQRAVWYIDRTIPDETRDEYAERVSTERAFWIPFNLSYLPTLH